MFKKKIENAKQFINIACTIYLWDSLFTAKLILIPFAKNVLL